MSDRVATAEHPVTWQRFIELADDDLRELIDGQLVEVEVPGKRHEAAVGASMGRLGPWARDRGRGRVFPSGYKVRISDTRGVMPDLQLLSNDAWAAAEERGLESGRPDLVVEVLSPSSRRYDRVVKLRFYASIGVPEYWIVDPEERTLERLVLGEGGYLIAETAQDDQTFEPSGFEGLVIPLAELWL